MSLENTDAVELNSSATATEDEIKLVQGADNTDTGGERQGSNDPDEDGEVSERGTRVDEELEAANTDAEREAIRERRRLERQQRKERQKSRTAEQDRRIQALAEQNRQLQNRLIGLESHNAGSQLAQLQINEQQADNAIVHFKAILADATTKGDGVTAAEATEKLLQAQTYKTQVSGQRQNFETQVRTPKSPQLDPLMVNHAQKFMGDNKWFKGATAADPDSRVLAALDNSLAAEGWDPSSEAYWTELASRGAKYLPHRFNGSQSQQGGQKDDYNGTTTGNQRSSVAGSNANNVSGQPVNRGYKVSEARVKAMKDAGIWDDPARRTAMIKRYQEADRQG